MRLPPLAQETLQMGEAPRSAEQPDLCMGTDREFKPVHASAHFVTTAVAIALPMTFVPERAMSRN